MNERGVSEAPSQPGSLEPPASEHAAVVPDRVRHTGRHIVLLRKGSGDRGAQLLRNMAGLRVHSSVHREAAGETHHPAPGEGVLFHTLDAGLLHIDPDQLAALEAQSGGDVVMIEPERMVKAIRLEDTAGMSGGTSTVASHVDTGSAGPVDERHDTWGLQATGVVTSRYSGRGVRVAILDTGLDLRHPDFLGRTIVSKSFVTGASIDDVNGHGTYCAGVACGPSSPTQAPRYGVAGGADLFIGKIIGDDGSGADGNILAGIDWAVRGGCDVVSLSVGTPVAAGESYSPIFEQVAQRALNAGVLIIAAAGNDSLRPDNIAPVDHPANCPSILAIAAVDPSLGIALFSCGGVNSEGGEVDIAAPGVAIRSAWPRPALYRIDSGTSMATPYVAGIAALIAEANPSVRGRDLLALLTRSARPLGLPARDVGVGLVQAP